MVLGAQVRARKSFAARIYLYTWWSVVPEGITEFAGTCKSGPRARARFPSVAVDSQRLRGPVVWHSLGRTSRWKNDGRVRPWMAALTSLPATPLLLLLQGALGVQAQLNSLHPVAGDFVLRANISQCDFSTPAVPQPLQVNSGKNTLEVVFDGVSTGNYSSYSLQPSTGMIELLRYRLGNKTVLQTIQSDPASWRAASPEPSASSPLLVELVRRGTFYLLYLGGSHLTSQPATYVERPTSDVICLNHAHAVEPELEPMRSSAGIRDVSGGVFQLNSLRVDEYRWESAPLPTEPVLSHCSSCGVDCDASRNKTDGCWAYNQIIPGALLRQANSSHRAAGLRNGSVVIYVAGSDWDGTDGGGRQRMGVATGSSLEALTLNPNFLLEGTTDARDERSIFPNGALLLENGTVALTYMGQAQNDSWGGVFLATSNCSVGCPWHKHGVVLGCGGDAAHTSGADPQASRHLSQYYPAFAHMHRTNLVWFHVCVHACACAHACVRVCFVYLPLHFNGENTGLRRFAGDDARQQTTPNT
eukprot:COSAG02_NODE_7789_length_2844_cov_141.457356_1_plen_530_part_00